MARRLLASCSTWLMSASSSVSSLPSAPNLLLADLSRSQTVPLRNTNLPHLRDGFSRALVARMKLPHVSGAISEEDSEVSSRSGSATSEGLSFARWPH